MPLSIEERTERVTQIDARLAEIDAANAGDLMPADVRDEWNTLNVERDEHTTAIAELHARRQRLAAISQNNPAALERPDPSAGPALLRSRGTEIYDLARIRRESTTEDEYRERLRDNAKRAIERAVYGSIRRVTREDAQTNALRLLEGVDDKHGTLAKRILATGSPEYDRWFWASLAGRGANVPRPQATLQMDDDAGLAVPFQLDPTVILTSDGVINPLRRISRVEQIVGNTWKGLTSGGITVSRSSEAQEATNNTPDMAQPSVDAERVLAFIQFSFEADQDWTRLRSEMTTLLQDAKDTEEADSFLNDDGTPPAANGLVTTLSTTSDVNDGFASFTSGDLYDVEEALPPRFRARASWIGAKSSYNLARQLGSTNDGADLWVRLAQGQPPELIGYSAYEASEMPARSSDNRYLILGDFNQFLIVDRVGMSVEVVPHVFGSNRRPTGQRGLVAFWRNNSLVLADNAFRALVNAT